jgi:hypothetical protein
MEEPTKTPVVPTATDDTTLGRRELLKALAATGGAVTVVSMLPGQWTRPIIEAGVLPVHAQVSPVVFSLQIIQVFQGGNFGNISTSQNGELFFCEMEIIVQVTPPTQGVEVVYEVTEPTGSDCAPDSQLTDAAGQATFLFDASCLFTEQREPVPFTLLFSFADQGTYGPDTATLSAELSDPFGCFENNE